jgi:hypothetical protein
MIQVVASRTFGGAPPWKARGSKLAKETFARLSHEQGTHAETEKTFRDRVTTADRRATDGSLNVARLKAPNQPDEPEIPAKPTGPEGMSTGLA